MKTLTIGQLQKACVGNQYIAVRTSYGRLTAINCGISKTKFVNKFPKTKRSSIVSFYPIGFQEYISLKAAFTDKRPALSNT